MPELKKVEDYEGQRELGTVWMLIGGLFWIFGFLVMFFNPAALKLGKMTMVEIASVMAVIGLVAFFYGRYVRAKAV